MEFLRLFSPVFSSGCFQQMITKQAQVVQLALQTFFLSHTAIRFPRRAESSYTSETEVSLNQALVNAQNASPSRSSRCGVFLLGEDSLGPGARATSYSTPRTSKLKNRKVNLQVNRVPSASSRHGVHALLNMDSLRRSLRFVHCVACHDACPQGLCYVYRTPWTTFA